MFYLSWIALTATGILASIAVFIWALRSGQFSDQGRARYLPLSDEFPLPVVENPSRLSLEVYALLFAIGMGLLGILVVVVLTLHHMKG
jgi:cbb3-type cytochrome oxidase maturation protein